MSPSCVDGDLVGRTCRLRSGGPELTVLAIPGDVMPGAFDQTDPPTVPRHHVAVGWFDGGTFIAAVLPCFALTPPTD